MFLQAKPKPKRGTALKERRARRRKLLADDLVESRKAIDRSQGQCELMTKVDVTLIGRRLIVRCTEPGEHVHHLISGNGKRAIGSSRLAEHKLFLCRMCHHLIHAKKLRRVGGIVPRWTDCYERVD